MPTRSTLPGSGGTGDVAGGVFHAADVDKLPGGRGAYQAVTTADINVTTVTTVCTITFTALASRSYYAEGSLQVQSSAIDSAIVSITDAANTSLRDVSQALPVADTDVLFHFGVHFSPSAGSYTVKLRADGGGAGTAYVNHEPLLTNIAYIRVIDEGPTF